MVRLLEWDTEFFQFRIGSIEVAQISEINLKDLQVFDLVYVFSRTKDENLPETFLFADEKLTYHKRIDNQPILIEKDIYSVFSEETDIRLIDLAYQAGIYSRFNIDRNFPPDSFKKLYKQWMIHSVNRLIAKEVYVLKTLEEHYQGFITLGVKNGIPDIGLIAVDQNSRGKGIGTKLLKAAESWAYYVEHANEIQVVTQGLNKEACSFYEKNGFAIASRHYVYHWWSPKCKR